MLQLEQLHLAQAILHLHSLVVVKPTQVAMVLACMVQLLVLFTITVQLV